MMESCASRASPPTTGIPYLCRLSLGKQGRRDHRSPGTDDQAAADIFQAKALREGPSVRRRAGMVKGDRVRVEVFGWELGRARRVECQWY